MQHFKYKLPLLLIIIISVFITSFTVAATNEIGTSVSSMEKPYQSYTYWENINTSEKVMVYSKPMYSFKDFVRTSTLGGDKNSSLVDVVADKKYIYMLDSGLGKIYVLDTNYKMFKTIEHLSKGTESLNFKGAKGICVDSNGLIYIADTNNKRVLVCDINCDIKDVLLLPQSNLIPSDFKYKPVKVAVDKKGYKYIASEGSYYGALLYSPNKEFLGFFGANTVKPSVGSAISGSINKLFSNDSKRAADVLSLPFTFTDIKIGPDNFVYTSTGKTTKGQEIQTGQVCMYNPGGKEILHADSMNFADYLVGTLDSETQNQDIVAISVDDDGYLYLLDRTYGRIFLYDSQCQLLSVFGGSLGPCEQGGTFNLPTSIALNGTDIIITDSGKNGYSVFNITDYGALVKKADTITIGGSFTKSQDLWQNIINQDKNNQLAYRGMAKSLYEQGECKEAMKYAYDGYDRDTYAAAFKTVRNEWIENHFALVFLIAVLIVALFIFIPFLYKKLNLSRFKKFNIMMSSPFHPVDSFKNVKYKGMGSVIGATVLLALFYVIFVLNDISGGFIFTVFDSEGYNALYMLLGTAGLVVLWSVSNWLVCTLLGGIAKLKEIYIITCYSLIPIIFGYALRLILTHVLVADEGAFINIMIYALILYSLFMLIIGIITVQDYEFGKFIGTTILTIVAMLIIVFILLLIVMLAQQLFGWLVTVFLEIKSRL